MSEHYDGEPVGALHPDDARREYAEPMSVHGEVAMRSWDAPVIERRYEYEWCVAQSVPLTKRGAAGWRVVPGTILSGLNNVVLMEREVDDGWQHHEGQ